MYEVTERQDTLILSSRKMAVFSCKTLAKDLTRWVLLHKSKLISPVALCWGTYLDVVEPGHSTIRGADSPSAQV
jgi:hypothetical protein